MKTHLSRRLTLAHFAAMRAHLQGVEESEIGERYLYLEGSDPRSVRAAIKWIRTAMITLATSHERSDLAQALAKETVARSDEDFELPSLDDFAAERGMEEFSQADIELAFYDEFKEHLGKPSKRSTLRKTLDAITELQHQSYRAPSRSDALAEWFTSRLTEKFLDADVSRIDELMSLIDTWGANWHRRVNGIGELKAQRIEAWLTEHGDELGFAIKTQTSNDLAVKATEGFAMPVEYDLAQRGANRAETTGLVHSLGANNDQDAIRVFLRGYHGHTLRAYSSALERLIVWSQFVKRKTLSDLTIDDAYDYADFLAKPDAQWVSEDVVPRSHKAWKPLRTGDPAPATVKRSIAVIQSFGSFLTAHAYWRTNVFAPLKSPKSPRTSGMVEKAFLPAEWDLVRDHVASLKAMPSHRERALRLDVLLTLGYETGLRCAELASLTCGSFYRERVEQQLVWFVHVIGKGGKERDLPLRDGVVRIIERCLEVRGLPSDLSACEEAIPVVAQLRNEGMHTIIEQFRMSESGIYKVIKNAFTNTAKGADRATQKRIMTASTHWLRHTFCTVALEHGTPLDVVQEIAGHADLATTRNVYAKTRKARLAQYVQS